jgi:DNA-binding PadR family transcriptional regulator
MALRYALLGFLNLSPMTGYELKKNLDRSTQAFWQAGLNQIYPTLKTLEETGLVAARVEPQEGKPDRRIYRITADGRAELLEWLARPVRDLPPSRNVALLKLFFAGFLGREEILLHLRSQLALHQDELRRYRRALEPMIAEIVARTGRKREGTMWELVRQFGEAHERTCVDWLKRAIRTVEALE